MEKKENFEPKDSARRVVKDEQAVVQREDPAHNRKRAKITAAALKRKFSEHPPTKHNSKT